LYSSVVAGYGVVIEVVLSCSISRSSRQSATVVVTAQDLAARRLGARPGELIRRFLGRSGDLVEDQPVHVRARALVVLGPGYRV
jgi:hypothetical protein